MRLVLEFYNKAYWNEKGPPLRCLGTIKREVPVNSKNLGEVSPEGERIDWREEDTDWKGEDTVWVQAHLEDCDVTGINGRFRLQLAYEPDEKGTTDKDGFFVDKEGDSSIQLLRGAGGPSYLRLLKRTGKKQYDEEVAHWLIGIKIVWWKREALHAMAKELLKINPTAVTSPLQGLSFAPIEENWILGEGSHEIWELNNKLKALMNLVKLLAPHFNAIRQRSAVTFKKRIDKIPYGRLQNPHQIVSSERCQRGDKDVKRKVRAKALRVSTDLPIHCAIKDFLFKLENDIRNMLQRVNRAVERDEMSLLRLPPSAREADSSHRLNTENKYRRVLLKTLQVLLERCRLFQSGVYPWAGCSRKSIVTVAARSVPTSASYQKVYLTILEFHSKRFFSDCLEGRHLVPEYRLDSASEYNEVPSTWQRNYSAIYESWVLNRLVTAFMKEGFVGLGDNYRELLRQRVKDVILGARANDPICAVIADGNMKIELIHGVLAYEGGMKFSVHKRRHPLTPDFAVVFSPVNANDGRCHWLVVDAKSGTELHDRDVDQRDRYKEHINFKHNRDLNSTGGRRPDQAWLVYSGRTDKRPGIEFNRDDPVDICGCWAAGLDSEYLFATNETLRWSNVRITGWEKSENEARLQPVGNVRANIVAMTTFGYDVFAEFAKVQIATAKDRLGIP